MTARASRAAARSTAASEQRTKRSAPKSERPKLRLVDKKALKSRSRRRTVIISSLGLLVVGMFMTTLAHARLVEGQRELDVLRGDIAELDGRRAQLEGEIVISSSPEAIVARARVLGMVRASDPQYLVAVRRPSGS